MMGSGLLLFVNNQEETNKDLAFALLALPWLLGEGKDCP